MFRITASQHVTAFLFFLVIAGLSPLGVGVFLILRSKKTKAELDSLQ